jgi:hypothetical protein
MKVPRHIAGSVAAVISDVVTRFESGQSGWWETPLDVLFVAGANESGKVVVWAMNVAERAVDNALPGTDHGEVWRTPLEELPHDTFLAALHWAARNVEPADPGDPELEEYLAAKADQLRRAERHLTMLHGSPLGFLDKDPLFQEPSSVQAPSLRRPNPDAPA